jgi:hypothetical protein
MDVAVQLCQIGGQPSKRGEGCGRRSCAAPEIASARYFESAATGLRVNVERKQPCAEARPRNLCNTRPELKFVFGEVVLGDGENLADDSAIL